MHNTPPTRRFPIAPERLTWLLVALGVGLRLIYYFHNRSLWTDEAAVAGQIIARSFDQVFRPMDDPVQVSPLGFLIVTKLFVAILGDHDLLLRLFPLLCGISSLVLFPFLARRILRPQAVLIAVALFSFCYPLVYHSSEVKHYACDVLTCILLYLGATFLGRPPWPAGRAILAAFAGLLAVFFSLPASLILAGLGLVWICDSIRERRWGGMASVSLLSLLWAAAFFGMYTPTILQVSAVADATTWPDAYFLPNPIGFVPLPPWSPATGFWLGRSFMRIFSVTLGWKLAALPACALLVGCVRTWTDRRSFLFLAMSPLLINLIISGFKLYPFGDRFLVYLAPVIILIVAEGAAHILTLRNSYVGPIFVGLLLLLPMLASGFNPTERYGLIFIPRGREEMRSVVRYMNERRLPGDTVYVNWFSQITFRYYWPREGGSLDDCIFGTPTLGKLRLYGPELERLRGKGRTWIVFSHDFGKRPITEESIYLERLDRMGTRLLELRPPGAAVYLYDLKE